MTDFGLWGTADPNKVLVTPTPDDPEDGVGFVVEISGGVWKIESDPAGVTYPTPAKAAAALLEMLRSGGGLH